METSRSIRQEAFKGSESIFAVAPFPMWIFDLETLKFLAVNIEAIQVYGYSEEEFLSMTIEEIRPAEDLPLLDKAVEKIRTKTEIFKDLFRHKKQDGSIINVQIKGNPIIYQGRKAELVTAIDLTERLQEQKRIEKQSRYLKTIENINERLLKSEDWFPALNECFGIIGETLELDRIYFFQNDLKERSTTQRLEWTSKKVKAQTKDSTLQELSFSELPIFMEPLQRGKNFEAVVSELPPSPTKKFLQDQEILSVLVTPVMSQNSFTGFLGMSDCTAERSWTIEEVQIIQSLTTNLAHVIARENIQTELANNEYKYRTMVQTGSDLIATLDADRNFKYVNGSSKEVLGISPNEFIGKNVNEYVHPEDLNKVEECLKEVLQKEVVSIPTFRFPDASGNYRWVETRLTNFLNDPVISGIVAHTWDVTSEMENKRERDLVDSISKAIGRPTGIKESLGQALLELLNLPEICLGEVWIKSQDETRMDLRAFRYKTSDVKPFYSTYARVDSLDYGKGFPGHIWIKNQTTLWENLSEHQHFARRGAAKKTGLQTAIGVPITYNDEFLGSFILFSQAGKKKLADVEKLLKAIGNKLGAVVKQKITEDEYRSFFEISPDPHCIIGFDGYLKKLNHSFSELLEYEETTLVNREIFSFIHEEDRAKALRHIESSLANEKSQSFTVRFKTKQGEIKWLIWSVTLIPEAKILLAVAKDITEQKLAEQELKKTYSRLETAQKIAKLGYFRNEIGSDFSEWSEETFKIFGYTPENFKPTIKNISKAIHPEDRYLLEGDFTEHLIPDQIQSFEYRILRSSGEVRWVHQEVYFLTDEKGYPKSIEGTIQDITDTKEKEEQLKISNERFRLAMKASNEMIWEVDHQKNIINRGTGNEDVVDYELSEPYVFSNSWSRKIHPEDVNRVWESFQDILKDPQKSYWREEYRILLENGTTLFFIDRCYIYKDEKGNPVRSVGSILDVTASRLQLERIKLQNEQLKEIAWHQSHVIRAPLAKIMGLIELVKNYQGGGLSLENILEMISTSAHELDKVIHDIAHKTEIIDENDTRNSANR